MCGICGIVYKDQRPVKSTDLHPMMHAMKHRGPDDEGVYTDRNTGLGHVRLSILDLSERGHQPMATDDDTLVMTYNGEIYNYLELREELSSKYTFKSNTDSEVLLYAYREWGTDCLHRLNGMFAFAIYDTKDQSLFAARDRFGIKPFYYYHDNKAFYFASEIPALLTQPITREPNEEIIADFLLMDRVHHNTDTFFRNIQKLEHGHCLTLESGRLKIHRWYKLEDEIKTPFDGESDYQNALRRAVKWRMRSDVPVGACLSGGLDSSSIVSLMTDGWKSSDLHTFSAVYNPGDHGDESEFIDCYADHPLTKHVIHPNADALKKELKGFISGMGEPFPTLSIYAGLKVMELAHGQVKVLLNGQGADEALGGYHYFFGYYFRQLFRQFKWFSLLREMGGYWGRNRSWLGFKSMVFFFLPYGWQRQLSANRKGYIDPQFATKHTRVDQGLKRLYSAPTLRSALIRHFEYKMEHLLYWGDKTSMLHSIEVRFPFLDHELVEKTVGMSNKKLMLNGVTKVVLRESMKDLLPEKIRTRQDKVGFETPSNQWLRTPEWLELIQEVFRSESFRNRSFVQLEGVNALFTKFRSGAPLSNEIWKLLNLELWFRHYIDPYTATRRR